MVGEDSRAKDVALSSYGVEFAGGEGEQTAKRYHIHSAPIPEDNPLTNPNRAIIAVKSVDH
jgi:hypothetical protein